MFWGGDQPAVVDAWLEVHLLTVPFQHWNEGQKGTSLEAVFVQFWKSKNVMLGFVQVIYIQIDLITIRRPIWGGHQNDASVKKLFEEVP